eukprot:gene2559-2933_t
MDECEHRFCNDCLEGHYRFQITNQFPSLKCPDSLCKRIVTYQEVGHIIKGELFEAYDKLLLTSSLERDSNIKYCPYPDCKEAMVVPKDEKHITCTSKECGYQYCGQCREEWHEGLTCEDWAELKVFISQHTANYDKLLNSNDVNPENSKEFRSYKNQSRRRQLYLEN